MTTGSSADNNVPGTGAAAGARTIAKEDLAPVLSIEGVSKTFRGGDRGEVAALAHFDLALGEGEFVAIIGPSGCGKSTLFNIVGGLTEGDTGRVLVDGHPVKGSHRDIGMVFQEESTFPCARCSTISPFRLRSPAWPPRSAIKRRAR